MEALFIFACGGALALLWLASDGSDAGEGGPARSEAEKEETRIVDVPCEECGEPMRWAIGRDGFGSMPLFRCMKCVDRDFKKDLRHAE